MVRNFYSSYQIQKLYPDHENFASDFPEILGRSLFYMKGVDKADSDLRSNSVE